MSALPARVPKVAVADRPTPEGKQALRTEGMDLAGKRSTPEQIITKLRQVEVLTAQGKPVAEAVRAVGMTEPTYYR
jgi:hypothetical protein